MNKKYYLFIIFVLLNITIITGSHDKQREIQLIEKKLPQLKGKEKIKILFKLMEFYNTNNAQKSIELAAEAKKIAINLKDKIFEFKIISSLSWSYRILGKYNRSEKYAKEALELSTQLKYNKGIASSLQTIGTLHWHRADYKTALIYFLKSLKIKELLGDDLEIGKTVNNIGTIYNELKKFNISLTYFNRALLLFKKTNFRRGIAISLGNMGIAYDGLNKTDEALKCYFESLAVDKEISDLRGSAMNLNYIGVVYQKKKEFKKALSKLNKSFNLFKKVGNQNGMVLSLLNIANTYFLLNDKKNALKYSEKSLKIAEEINERNQIRILKRKISSIYAADSNYKQAYESFLDFFKIHEQIKNENSQKLTEELREKYESEKREKENKILKQQNLIKDLKIEKEENIKNTLIIIVIFTLIILVFILKKIRYFFIFWKKKNYIGHYKIMEKIGSGGMGNIYKVKDITKKDSVFALKILREEYFEDLNHIKRFKHEALVIDQLNHPNIVKVIERGESDDGLYITMEYLNGITLREYILNKSKNKLEQILNIIKQIVSALELIHKKGVIHRDLKPDNIMLINGNKTVKLLDFGLAKTQTVSRMTETGMIMGSIYYMAPELFLEQQASEKSDIYSLGVIFYELISGFKPFVASNTVEVMTLIINSSPVSLFTIENSINKDIKQLIMDMIEKDPKKRPDLVEIKNILKLFENNK